MAERSSWVKVCDRADLLIHEVAMAKPEVAQTEAAKRISRPPHVAAGGGSRLFNGEAAARGPTAPQPPDYIAATRETYAGPSNSAWTS
jgi:hypothetical protein